MTSEAPEPRERQLEVARTIALDLLTARQRSIKELRDAMAKRNVPADVADEVLERFGEVGLVDDSAFAASLVASRSRYSQRGRARIRQELQAKGVDRDIAADALEALDPGEELESARAVAAKRARSLAGLEPQVARRRLAGVLARRGFPSDVVTRVLGEVLGSDVD